MRLFIIITVLVLGSFKVVYADGPQSICNNYTSFSAAEANDEYQRLLALSIELDSTVNKYTTAGIPETDPKFVATAKKLGDAIGQSYVLCKCNNSLSQSENCKAFIAHLKETGLSN